jgi:hypothetical protein
MLLQRGSVTAAFLAEHSPGLAVRNGMLTAARILLSAVLSSTWPVLRSMPGHVAPFQVEHTTPSTSTVQRPTTSAGPGTPSARASPISGRSRSPATADGGSADAEHGASEVLGHALAHHAHHEGHRPEQPQPTPRRREPTRFTERLAKVRINSGSQVRPGMA